MDFPGYRDYGDLRRYTIVLRGLQRSRDSTCGKVRGKWDDEVCLVGLLKDDDVECLLRSAGEIVRNLRAPKYCQYHIFVAL